MERFDSAGEARSRSEVQSSPRADGIWHLPDELQMMVAEGCGPMIIELLAIFKSDTATRLREVDLAVTNGDIPVLRAQMLAMKGAARQLGAQDLATMCEQVEAAGSQALASEVPHQLRELVAARDQVIRAMDAYAGTTS